jgi:hypothetical protein
VAIPIIGSGSGGFKQDDALRLMRDALGALDYAGRVLIVRHSK